MTMRDLAPNISPAIAIAPAVHTGNATGAAVDLLGFNSCALVLQAGAIAGDGSFSVKIQHSDATNGGSFVDAPASDLTGDFPSPLTAEGAFRQSYIGTKRYVRAVLTRASGTSIAASAMFNRSHAASRPA